MILFCGPSGSGKTTIVHYILARDSRFKFSISATTRKKRSNEKDGEDYHFLSVEEFKKKINEDAFIEWEEVYENGFYGTLHSEVDKILAEGKIAVFDLDVEGGLNIKKQFGEKVLSVFVRPPDIESLKQRLTKRATETAEDLRRRLDKAVHELTFADRFDKVLINDNIDESCRQVEAWLKGYFSISK
jgi:guanylate kinase